MGIEREGGTEVIERDEVQEPPLYRVILWNDDFTSMEFVVWLLTGVFHHDETSAFQIMLGVHQKGSGVAGVYPKEIAEMKTKKSIEAAEAEGFPLRVSIEPE